MNTIKIGSLLKSRCGQLFKVTHTKVKILFMTNASNITTNNGNFKVTNLLYTINTSKTNAIGMKLYPDTNSEELIILRNMLVEKHFEIIDTHNLYGFENDN